MRREMLLARALRRGRKSQVERALESARKAGIDGTAVDAALAFLARPDVATRPTGLRRDPVRVGAKGQLLTRRDERAAARRATRNRQKAARRTRGAA